METRVTEKLRVNGSGVSAAALSCARQSVHTVEPTMPLLQLWERDASEKTNPQIPEANSSTELRWDGAESSPGWFRSSFESGCLWAHQTTSVIVATRVTASEDRRAEKPVGRFASCCCPLWSSSEYQSCRRFTRFLFGCSNFMVLSLSAVSGWGFKFLIYWESMLNMSS